jgi:glycosyltransferase involved in cell wall biosynthesis
VSAVAYGVIVPAYEAGRTIADALASLLAQDPPPAEIVVVDDGSQDATAALAAATGPPVRVVRQANAGPAAATDRALTELSTPLVAGLDADDLWLPGKAARQLAALAADPSLDMVFCRARVFDHGTDPLASADVQDGWSRSTMLARRSAVDAIGAVAQHAGDRTVGDMVDWLDRGRLLGLRYAMLPDVLAGRRRIAGSLSDHTETASYLPLVRAALARRRAG